MAEIGSCCNTRMLKRTHSITIPDPLDPKSKTGCVVYNHDHLLYWYSFLLVFVRRFQCVESLKMTGNAAACNSYMYFITALSHASAQDWFVLSVICSVILPSFREIFILQLTLKGNNSGVYRLFIVAHSLVFRQWYQKVVPI